jgi:pre-mRNA-splicing helicase BRR2
MLIQAMFINQNSLMQLPYFNNDLIKKCVENKINDINDLINMNDNEINELLNNFNEEMMNEIAEICNRIPNIEMKIKLNKKTFKINEIASVEINLIRDVDDDVNVLSNVHSNFFPGVKEENWWIVVCLMNKIVVIKRINFCKKINLNVEFKIENEIGIFLYKIYLICDSWIGCDLEESFNIEIK